jgi:hypothetical protein
LGHSSQGSDAPRNQLAYQSRQLHHHRKQQLGLQLVSMELDLDLTALVIELQLLGQLQLAQTLKVLDHR